MQAGRAGGGPQGARGAREEVQAAADDRGDEEPLQAALIALDPLHGLRPGARRRARLPGEPVQPRRPGAAAAGLALQAVRLPRPRSSKRDLVPSDHAARSLHVDSPIALVVGHRRGRDLVAAATTTGSSAGPMTVRQALEQSINIPTVRIAVTETAPGQTLLPDIVETARARRDHVAAEGRTRRSRSARSRRARWRSPPRICTFANGGFRVKPNALLGLVTPSRGRRMESKDEPLVRGADADAVVGARLGPAGASWTAGRAARPGGSARRASSPARRARRTTGATRGSSASRRASSSRSGSASTTTAA